MSSFKVNNRLQLAQCLKGQTEANGGVTINHEFEAPKDGYMVSFDGGLETEKPTVNAILGWMADGDKYNAVAYGAAYFGGWKDTVTGVYHFDLSLCFTTLGAAECMARAENQKAIYDVSKKVEIRIS